MFNKNTASNRSLIFKIIIILILLAILWYARGIIDARQKSLVTNQIDRWEEVDTEKNTGSGSELANAYSGIDLLKILFTPAGVSSTPSFIASDTPQFVVLSFDGSKSVPMLDETLDFAQKMKNEGKPLHFTYFISAVYFLTDKTASRYTAPRHEPGTSNIGFSKTEEDITLRSREFNRALREGHEIGSHAVGHYDGTTWSYDEWKHEFSSFNTLVSAHIKDNKVRGFRAPLLGVGDDMYKVLRDGYYQYDTSGVGHPEQWPKKNKYGTWLIPLGIVYLGEEKTPVIAMDYSLWVHQSQAQEIAKKGTPLWQKYYDELLAGYMNYFNTNYKGTRAPIVIGNHFSKWNDGVYWEVMKTFAERVCGQVNVRCVTFRELVTYLNSHGV